MLYGLVPHAVVREHKDGIYEAMDEMAGIIVELNGSSWSQSCSECVGQTYDSIRNLGLQHGHLGAKLRALGRTLPLYNAWVHPYNIDFELRPPLHSC